MAKAYLLGMDGVLVRNGKAIPGAVEFIEKLKKGGHKFVIVTNNSRYTALDLKQRLNSVGFDIGVDHLFTSAAATAHFVMSQKNGGSAYVLGGAGLYDALRGVVKLVEYSPDQNPDVVILGEAESYQYKHIIEATTLVGRGVQFIATDIEPYHRTEKGILPGCGAMAALLEKATGSKPYSIGKPSPLMMTLALQSLGETPENAVMVGDDMAVDIWGAISSGLRAVLTLSGVTTPERLRDFSYRPDETVNSVADINP